MGYGTDYNHFQMGGGLNLRGYAGYLAPIEDKNGKVVIAYQGTSGAAINAELEFDQFFKFFKPKPRQRKSRPPAACNPMTTAKDLSATLTDRTPKRSEQVTEPAGSPPRRKP
jgi:hypothetical protein